MGGLGHLCAHARRGNWVELKQKVVFSLIILSTLEKSAREQHMRQRLFNSDLASKNLANVT